MTVTVVDRGEHEGLPFEIRKSLPDARWGKNWLGININDHAAYTVVRTDGDLARVEQFCTLHQARQSVGKFQAEAAPKAKKGRKKVH